MTQKEIMLTKIKADCARTGSVSKETLRLFTEVRCSKELFDKACWEGQKIRDSVHAKHKVYELQSEDNQARDAIRRYMSCGYRLDTPDAIKLINNLHTAKEKYKAACESCDKECESL